MNNSIWNTCIGEAIRKAKLSGTLIPSNEVDEIISELEKLKRTTPKKPETVQGNEVEKGRCDTCGCHPSVIYRTEFGTFCKEHVRCI